jgi:hypothetical protein
LDEDEAAFPFVTGFALPAFAAGFFAVVGAASCPRISGATAAPQKIVRIDTARNPRRRPEDRPDTRLPPVAAERDLRNGIFRNRSRISPLYADSAAFVAIAFTRRTTPVTSISTIASTLGEHGSRPVH